jgi:hypothetical protein
MDDGGKEDEGGRLGKREGQGRRMTSNGRLIKRIRSGNSE